MNHEEKNPYASPRRFDDNYTGQPESRSDLYGFAPATGLRKTALVLAAGMIVVNIIYVITWIIADSYFDKTIEMGEGFGAITIGNAFDIAVGGIYVLVAISFAIVFLSWLNRSYKNTYSFDQDSQRFKPGWVVGYWFIPIVSLFRPVQVVNDTWRIFSSSEQIVSAREWTTPREIEIWWFFWILSCGFENATMRSDSEALIAASAFFNFFYWASTFVVILQIGKLQEEARNNARIG